MGRGQTRPDRAEPASADAFCPVLPVVELVFSRWATAILWLLSTHGPLRFGRLRDGLVPITAKVLTDRLRQLERDGLVSRHEYDETPSRVEYALTALGASLSPVFATVGAWSRQHMPQVEAARRAHDAQSAP
jgi:DNA-binding HxlR family transcriptional regulator